MSKIVFFMIIFFTINNAILAQFGVGIGFSKTNIYENNRNFGKNLAAPSFQLSYEKSFIKHFNVLALIAVTSKGYINTVPITNNSGSLILDKDVKFSEKYFTPALGINYTYPYYDLSFEFAALYRADFKLSNTFNDAKYPIAFNNSSSGLILVPAIFINTKKGKFGLRYNTNINFSNGVLIKNSTQSTFDSYDSFIITYIIQKKK
jgi:hypothetical protein